MCSKGKLNALRFSNKLQASDNSEVGDRYFVFTTKPVRAHTVRRSFQRFSKTSMMLVSLLKCYTLMLRSKLLICGFIIFILFVLLKKPKIYCTQHDLQAL